MISSEVPNNPHGVILKTGESWTTLKFQMNPNTALIVMKEKYLKLKIGYMKILKGIYIRNDLFNPIIHIISIIQFFYFPKQNADFSNSPPMPSLKTIQ